MGFLMLYEQKDIYKLFKKLKIMAPYFWCIVCKKSLFREEIGMFSYDKKKKRIAVACREIECHINFQEAIEKRDEELVPWHCGLCGKYIGEDKNDGWNWGVCENCKTKCPKCNSENYKVYPKRSFIVICLNCYHVFSLLEEEKKIRGRKKEKAKGLKKK